MIGSHLRSVLGGKPQKTSDPSFTRGKGPQLEKGDRPAPPQWVKPEGRDAQGASSLCLWPLEDFSREKAISPAAPAPLVARRYYCSFTGVTCALQVSPLKIKSWICCVYNSAERVVGKVYTSQTCWIERVGIFSKEGKESQSLSQRWKA